MLAPAEGEAEDRRAEFTVALVSRAGEVGPWPIWRRDTVIAKSPREPHAQSSERIIVFRIAFDWPLVHGRKVRRASGRLYPFVRVPVALDGDRRGYLRWRMWSFGRWSIEDGDLLVHSRGLDAPTQFVHHRHGPI